jgi:hypothetical protein
MTSEPSKIKVRGKTYYNMGLFAASSSSDASKFNKFYGPGMKGALKSISYLEKYKRDHDGCIIRSEVDPASKAKLKRLWATD